MVGEVFAGIGAFKTMFDIAKSLKDMDDTVRRNAAIADLGEQIISAQTRYTIAVEQIRDLEEKLRNLETWKREKEGYELKALQVDVFAYMLKPSERGSKPPHWLCANCYEDRKKSIFQWTPKTAMARRLTNALPAKIPSRPPPNRNGWINMPQKPKPKLTDAERHARFVETARKVEASDDPEDFDKALMKVANPKDGSSQGSRGQKNRSG